MGNDRLIWSDSYKTGVIRFDNQHQGLFERYNRIINDIENNENNDMIKQHLNYLYVYTINHFVDEEEALVRSGLDLVKEQKEEHRQLKEQVEHYMEMIHEPMFPYAEFLEFVKNWLTHHILEVDMKFKGKLPEDA